MSVLDKQELHNLGMNIVGKDLKKKNFEFLAVNSDLKKNPQFIIQNEKQELVFVIVRVVVYPEDPNEYDVVWMETFKKHALSKEAKIYYAGVGLANSEDMLNPISKDKGFIVKYDGYKIL